MHLRELQEWVREFDLERKWVCVPPTHILANLIEEVGEISREVLKFEGYKKFEGSKERLLDEITDALMLLVKLANTFELDLEKGIERAMGRYKEKFGEDAVKLINRRYVERLKEALRLLEGSG